MLIKNRRKLRDLVLFFGVLYLFVGTETCHAQGKPDEIKALLKERRDLLSEVSTQMSEVFLARLNITMQELVQVERDSLKADLDWFERPKDRIEAIEKHKERAEFFVKVAKGRLDGGKGTKYAVLQARAYVAEVQIELLKEKRKAKPGEASSKVRSIADLVTEYRGRFKLIAPLTFPYDNSEVSIRLESHSSPEEKEALSRAFSMKSQDEIKGVLKWVLDPGPNSRKVVNPSNLGGSRRIDFVYEKGTPSLNGVVRAEVGLEAIVKSKDGALVARLTLESEKREQKHLLSRWVTTGPTVNRAVYLVRLAFIPNGSTEKVFYVYDDLEVNESFSSNQIIQAPKSISPINVAVFERIPAP